MQNSSKPEGDKKQQDAELAQKETQRKQQSYCVQMQNNHKQTQN